MTDQNTEGQNFNNNSSGQPNSGPMPGQTPGQMPGGGYAPGGTPRRPYAPNSQMPPLPPKSRPFLSWPMAFIIVWVVTIGGCLAMGNGFVSNLANVGASMQDYSFLNKPAVGVLVVEGEISGSVWATETLHRFANSEKIAAVVIRVDSPGGSVAPCQEIYNAVQKLRAKNKPVIISMGSVAASGGLYIAAAGDEIYANPGTLTGSIGVIMQTVEVEEAMMKLGIKSEVIKTGAYKDTGSPFRQMRADERQLLEKMILIVYEQFINDLAAGRQKKMKIDDIRKIADGRIFSGQEALELGLIDQLGGFEDALAKAASIAGLPPERPEVVYEDGRLPWWQTAMESKTGGLLLSEEAQKMITPGVAMKYIYQPGL